MSSNTQSPGTGGMSAFDNLPASIRKALTDYPQNMSAEFALSQIKRGVGEKELLRMLEDRKAALVVVGVKPL